MGRRIQAWSIHDSDDSQTFAMNVLANTRIPGKMFSALITSIVIKSRANKSDVKQTDTVLTTKSNVIPKIGEDLLQGNEVQDHYKVSFADCLK